MSEPKNPQAAAPPKRARAAGGPEVRGAQKKTHQATLPSRPPPGDLEGWKQYWTTRGQPWRREPEIDEERQKHLAGRRALQPDVEQGIYPFKDMKLSRADIEWLLATHEGGRGPVEWSDARERTRAGLDIRGADLRSVNLSGLPLANLHAGMRYWSSATAEQHGAAIAHLEGASLVQAHLEGAFLAHAHLENADASAAHLEQATLNRAHLKETWLVQAHLEGASLKEAHLEGAALVGAHLAGATLRSAFLDHSTNLEGVLLADERVGSASLVDVHWNGTNLAVVPWDQVSRLGDEHLARQNRERRGAPLSKSRVGAFEEAVRAQRQLAVALREQGLNEVADRFAYRAQLLQRVVFRLQRHWLKYGFSGLLALLTGYGFRMWRITVAYVLAIGGFASLYYGLGFTHPPRIDWQEAVILSVTAFHGRVFSTPFTPNSPQVAATALEAIVGLLVEAVFIAMLTQRVFSR